MASSTKVVAAIELGANGVLQIVIAGRNEQELAAANDRVTDVLGEIIALNKRWRRLKKSDGR
jgi:hypothetical protein